MKQSILPPPMNANEFIEQELDERLRALEQEFDADVVAFNGDIVLGVDGLFRTAIEKKRQENPGRARLVVLITTFGGYIEVVHRIVDVLRHHYQTVEFIVPDYAYSAGTVLVMSGDAIHMDYYSRLGPIDPQKETEGGELVPATGYLRQYERLIKKAQDGNITMAEVQLLLSFDQAELYSYELQRQLSISLLQEWLTKYKFKNWKTTATRKIKVTEAMRKRRAKQIATALSDTERWHIHGYGISMAVLTNDLNLLIDDFGTVPHRSDQVRRYHSLLVDYMTKLRHQGVFHTTGHYHPISSAGG